LPAGGLYCSFFCSPGGDYFSDHRLASNDVIGESIWTMVLVLPKPAMGVSKLTPSRFIVLSSL
jgi:hypothetical protein